MFGKTPMLACDHIRRMPPQHLTMPAWQGLFHCMNVQSDLEPHLMSEQVSIVDASRYHNRYASMFEDAVAIVAN
jgi:hypothetical protein